MAKAGLHLIACADPAKLGYTSEAAVLVSGAMRAGIDAIAAGVRQCDAVAEIYRAQVAGTAAFGGDYTAICPLLPTGAATGTPHLTWSDQPFRTGDPTIL